MNHEKSMSPSVVHTITETSSKLLANTLIEMGMIANQNETFLRQLKYELEYAQNSLKDRQDQISKLRESLEKMQKTYNSSFLELAEVKKDFSVLRKHCQTRIQDSLVRDTIIDELLKRYKIAPADRKRIKKLREPAESTPGHNCNATCDNYKTDGKTITKSPIN